MRARRVVHLSTVHLRDDTRILHRECMSLARAGYEVVLVVGDGLGDARVEGVSVIDVGARPSRRLDRMRLQPARALAAVMRLEPDLVHFHDPELLPVGVRMARHGLQVVYDAHEDVPRQMLTKQWIPRPLRPTLSRLFEIYENRQVRRLAAVVSATPHIGARFNGIASRGAVVCNYPLPEELERPPNLVRERMVCYVGVLMRTRGLLQMVRAVHRLPGLRFVVCGRFEDAAFEAELRREPGWAQVDYRGQVGRLEVREVMARSRVGLVTLLPLPSYLDSLPIKMFEYMSAELPVVASDFPLWREIVERERCGICVDPTDPRAVADALARVVDDERLAAQMGRAGRTAVLARYNWREGERSLLGLYHALVGAP